MSLNIRYDAPGAMWDIVPLVYAQLEGWLGFGEGGDFGEEGIPYWFGFNENEKHISASVEPGGLQFVGMMDPDEWIIWVNEAKRIATRELGFQVGEIERGEVDD